MLARITALWTSGRLTAPGLAAAVARGWITQAEADGIAALPRD